MDRLFINGHIVCQWTYCLSMDILFINGLDWIVVDLYFPSKLKKNTFIYYQKDASLSIKGLQIRAPLKPLMMMIAPNSLAHQEEGVHSGQMLHFWVQA